LEVYIVSRSRFSILWFCLAACGEAPAPNRSAPKSYGLLPGADAESPVKIGSVENLCLQVAEGTRLAVTAMAFTGQRLRWKGTVQSAFGRRLVVGVDRLLVSLPVAEETALEFEPGDQVEIAGILATVDPEQRMLSLAADASVDSPH
jgi:hypothetical protein